MNPQLAEAAVSPEDLRFAFGLPPRRALQYLQNKGLNLETWNWWETWEAAHAQSFAVAKAMREDLLADLREAVERALREGQTARQFAAGLEPTLKAKGWWGRQVVVAPDGAAELVQLGSPHRLQTIYRTNMRSARAVAQYQVQQDTAEHRPFWMYSSMDDGRTRPSHRALNGLVFPHDDPFWDTHYPPNGFNCRCLVRAFTQAELDERGLTVASGDGHLHQVSQRVGIDKRTGEVITRPATEFRLGGVRMTPDPGWSYNPGKAAAPFNADPGFTPRIGVMPPPLKGQRNWKDWGLPEDMPGTPAGDAELMLAAQGERAKRRAFLAGIGANPGILPKRFTRTDGKRDARWFEVATPGDLEPVMVGHRFVMYLAGKDGDRDEFAQFVIPTLQRGSEVWLQAYLDKPTGLIKYKKVFLARFTRPDGHAPDIVAIVREEPKMGSLIWTLWDEEGKGINRMRQGTLLYRREED